MILHFESCNFPRWKKKFSEYAARDADGLQEVEHLLLRTKANTTLMQEKLGELHRRIDRQMTERHEAIAAVKSSKAFLGRGFRDIEMLLEAGFTELESKREESEAKTAYEKMTNA